MLPTLHSINGQPHGIARVVENWHRLAPEYGIQYVDEKTDDFDIYAIHAGTSQRYPEGTPFVSHLHGLYWTADYGENPYEMDANSHIIDSIRHSEIVTVPSDWTAATIRREMRISPVVIGHGIDVDEWSPGDNQGYVLWSKNRNMDVCDPEPVRMLAERAKETRFLATYAPIGSPKNVTIVGVQPFDKMKPMLRDAGVYLATTKETFGVQTLEAMACGVPVLGWNYGGTAEIVRHGVCGYLARPNDYDDLHTGLQYCLKHRATLGANAIQVARTFSWSSAVAKLRGAYDLALSSFQRSDDVTVVIPSWYGATTLKFSIESALEQTHPPKQIIVIDDGTHDEGQTKALVDEISARDGRVIYVYQDNKGVAVARNHGIALAQTPYVCCLDKDDQMAPQFLEACVQELKKDKTLGIAYTGIKVVNQKGQTWNSPWPGEWDFDRQLAHENQVPTCCVFRKEMWARVGGFRQRYAPRGAGSEDADFWTRCGEYGWKAKKATDANLFIYSMGAGLTTGGDKEYKEVNWLEYHPWASHGAPHMFASYAKTDHGSHPVRMMDKPSVSIIIPVSQAHKTIVFEALDSLEAQTFYDWEIILVDDSGQEGGWECDGNPDLFKAYPYIRVVKTAGNEGAGRARNLGAEIARGDFLLFMDADDTMLPDALEKMVRGWTQKPGIVYTSYYGKSIGIDAESANSLNEQGRLVFYDERGQIAITMHHAYDYDCAEAVAQPNEHQYIWCLISSLVPKQWHNEIGGFDESMASWEDWDYWIRMARAGKCFTFIDEPLFVYRFYTGQRREVGRQKASGLIEYLWKKYNSKRSEIMPCNCGGGGSVSVAQNQPQRVVQNAQGESEMESIKDSDVVLIKYMSGNMGQHRVVGPATQRDYGYRSGNEMFYIDRRDQSAMPSLFAKAQEEVKPFVENAAPVAPPEPKPIASPPAPKVETPAPVMPAPEPLATTEVKEHATRKRGRKKA